MMDDMDDNGNRDGWFSYSVMLMCGSLLHHFWEAVTSSFDVDIQIIKNLNAYDIGREDTIVTHVYCCTTIFAFHAYGLIRVWCILLWIANRGMEGKW